MSSDSPRSFDHDAAFARVDRVWDEEIVPALCEYIPIPCKSPAFDHAWRESGHLDRAVELIEAWCRERPLPGLHAEVVRLGGRTPLLCVEVPGSAEGTVLFYGHYDKQPEMTGWREDLDPWKAVLEGDRLYGRGGGDDGYAAFASLAALEVLTEQGLPHARAVMLIEGCEESGSPDLPAYLDHLAARIGTPDLVVCLDASCGDYERLWTTTSLRGNVIGDLHVEVLREGVHSGDASGIVPDSLRILRTLLSRIEDETTGEIQARELFVDIPPEFREQARAAADALGARVHEKFPFLDGVTAAASDRTELVLNQTWRPTVVVTGVAGIPAIEDAGNVIRPATAARLSLRIPPSLDGDEAAAAVKRLLERDPPYGARVRFEDPDGCSGWASPPLAPWLRESLHAASEAFFSHPPVHRGEGGTIPLMRMLSDRFPDLQFVVTGILGPGSNAHGPNEHLHLPTGKRVTACVARVLADHARR